MERQGHMDAEPEMEREDHISTHSSTSEDIPTTNEKTSSNSPREPSLHQVKSLEKSVSLPREILVVGTIALAQFTTQVGLGQTIAIIHTISSTFNLKNPGIESWLIAGYSLTVGTFILVSGRLGDMFGYKKMLIIGYSWFALWSMIAGLAVYENYVLFIFARVLQGIGPSICLPNALALLGVLYEPGKRKNMAFAVFGGVAPGGSIVGAVFASLFELAWWPWTFWSFALTLVVIAVVGAFVIPEPPTKIDRSKHTYKQLFLETDPLGAVVGVVALILFNFAWNQAPISGWNAPEVIVCLVLGLVLAPVFFYIELKVSPDPLIPLAALNSDAMFVLACIACGWGTFGIWVYYLWQQLEILRGISPLLACAYLAPLVVSGACAAGVTGIMLNHLRPAWVMTIALCAFFTGTVLIGTAPVHQTYWAQVFVCTLITPFGMDMSFPAATLILSNAVPKEKQGVAASMINTIVNYSISLGLGFAGTVEVHVNHGGNTPEETLQGYRGAFYMGFGLSGLGIFLACIFVVKSYWDERRVVGKKGGSGAV